MAISKRDAPYYCTVCSLPPEYCEWSGSFEKCKTTLHKENPQLFNAMYSDIPVESLEISDEPKEKPQTNKEKKKVKSQKVIIKKENRTKRKVTVTVQNLDFYGVDLKKAAKQFASRFACGSSVTKNAEGRDEIVIQGDVQDELSDYILEQFSQITEDQIQIVSK